MFILHAADLHLQFAAWQTLPSVYGDALASLDQLEQIVIKSKPDILVLGGDVFDSPNPHPFLVRRVLEFQKSVIDAGTVLLYVQGQHCRPSHLNKNYLSLANKFSVQGQNVPWLSLISSDKCIWLDPISRKGETYRLVSDSFGIQGFDHCEPEELKNLLETRIHPDTRVLVLHQLCQHSIADVTVRQVWDLSLDWVPPQVQLVLMGDRHKNWSYQHKDTIFVYPGSTSMQDLSEPPDKYVISAKYNQATWQVENIPLSTRRFYSYTILTEEDYQKFLLELKHIPDDSLVKLCYDPKALPFLRQELQEKINNRFHLAIRATLTGKEDSMPCHYGDGISFIESIVDRSKEPDFYCFIKELIECYDMELCDGIIDKYLSKLDA